MRPAWLTTANILWLLVYLAVMGGVVGGLFAARQAALASFDSDEARAEWNEFRADMQKIADDPDSSVARRVPKGDEPPTLRLLRDYFGQCLLLALILSSALFVTFMFMIRGALGTDFKPRE